MTAGFSITCSLLSKCHEVVLLTPWQGETLNWWIDNSRNGWRKSYTIKNLFSAVK